MGSAGHAFLSHTKALSPNGGVADGGWGLPPHPLQVCAGQRYWPRGGRRRRPLVVKQVDGGKVVAQRLDGAQEQVRLTCARLLATRPEDGQGRHYAFGGYVPKRYRSHAVVVAVEGDRAVLVVPAWHPARPVRLLLRELPAGSGPGDWLAVSADLGAASAPRLSLAALRPVEDPGPALAHRPAWAAKAGAEAAPPGAPAAPGTRAGARTDAPPAPRAQTQRPAAGRGCGDIVVRLAPSAAADWLKPPGATAAPTRRLAVAPQRPPEVHETGATPKLTSADRVYIAVGARLLGWSPVRSQRPHPNGDLFLLDAGLRPPEPAAVVGELPPFHNWRWRWWPRADAARRSAG